MIGPTFIAFVDVDVAFGPYVAVGAPAGVAAVDHAGLANGPGVARVRCAGVVQVAQEAGLVGWALADVRGHSVVASSAILARVLRAIVDVDLAIVAFVAVDADARVASLCVGARGPVLADIRPRGALVHILGAIASAVLVRTVTGIGVDPVHAFAPILAEVTIAVVHIDLAAGSGET